MSKAQVPAEAEVFVLSETCTTFFPDLDLLLPAGTPVLIPAFFLSRVLAHPGVVQVHLDPATPTPEED